MQRTKDQGLLLRCMELSDFPGCLGVSRVSRVEADLGESRLAEDSCFLLKINKNVNESNACVLIYIIVSVF